MTRRWKPSSARRWPGSTRPRPSHWSRHWKTPVPALLDGGARAVRRSSPTSFGSFGRCCTSLRTSRSRRVISATGLDIELAHARGPARDHLDALLEQARGVRRARAAALGVGAFLAYLALARRYGSSLAVPAPSGADGVALLTVHKAKGLEWHSVYVPQVVDGVFPSGQSRSTPLDLAAAVLPYPLRGRCGRLPRRWRRGREQGGRTPSGGRSSERERAEDRRLAYVAVTRAAERLVVTGHRWGPTQQTPRERQPLPSGARRPLFCAAVATSRALGAGAATTATNPALDETVVAAVAHVRRPLQQLRHVRRRPRWCSQRSRVQRPTASTTTLARSTRRRVQRVADLGRRPRRADRRGRAPRRPTVTIFPPRCRLRAAVALLRDTGGHRAASPAPAAQGRRRQPPHRGTRFHEWVEARFGQVPLIDLDGLVPEGEAELRRRPRRRCRRPSSPVPTPTGGRSRSRPRSSWCSGEQLLSRPDRRRLRGPEPTTPLSRPGRGTRWSTGRPGGTAADPLQLALYRLAWAELHQVPCRAGGRDVLLRAIRPRRASGRPARPRRARRVVETVDRLGSAGVTSAEPALRSLAAVHDRGGRPPAGRRLAGRMPGLTQRPAARRGR